MTQGPVDDAEVVVVGAGVIGLAVARAVARSGRDTLILEATDAFGTETSARNSEVIHAGIYYPRGSLKARFCVAGRDLLYAYCESHGVPYRRCGKLIVATSESQLPELERIRAAALANGVELEQLSAAQAVAMEPALRCVGALHSPATGIVDSHAYMLALLGEAESAGATLVCSSRVSSARVDGDGVRVRVANSAPMDERGVRDRVASSRPVDGGVGSPPSSRTEVRCRLLINCAGLDAPAVAGSIEGFPAEHVPRGYLAKGNYFALAGRSPFGRLVYPVPEPGGLGIHLTLDLARRARFGPDVEWIPESAPGSARDYSVDARRGDAFYAAIRRYWPELADGTLQSAYSGIRPKLAGPGEPAADFRIGGPAVHGMPGVINLFGIESPGLTASLAIADYVAEMIKP